MSFHSEQTENHVIHNFRYADEAERLADTDFTDADVGKVAIQEDTLQWFVLRTSNPSWADITAIVTGGDFTDVSENAIPVNTGNLIFKDSGVVVDRGDTEEWVFSKSINVPSGSVKIGTTLSLSEGNQSLVVGRFEDNDMSFAVLSPFDDATGSKPPFYIDYGPPFQISQLDDSVTITANPLTVEQPSTVVAPNVRLLDKITFRTDAAMDNVVMRFTDLGTGFIRRYVPSLAAWNGASPGMTFAAATDVTLHFADHGTDDANNIFLGFTPFLQRPGETTEVQIKADSVSLKGDASGFPYSIRELHDGPPIELLGADDAGELSLETLNLDVQENLGSTQINFRDESDEVRNVIQMVDSDSWDLVVDLSDSLILNHGASGNDAVKIFDINNEGRLVVGNVPQASTLTVGDALTTLGESGLTIENHNLDELADAILRWRLTDGPVRWAMGIDHSDEGALKIATTDGVDSEVTLRIQQDGDADFSASVRTPYGGFGRLQNYLTYSSELDNSDWIPSGTDPATVVANGAIAPDGTMTADVVTFSGPADGGLRQENVAIPGNTYNASLWIRLPSLPGPGVLTVDLGEGVPTTFEATDEWVRVQDQLVCGAGDWLDLFVLGGDSPTVIEMWGVQVSDGAELLTYLPTKDLPAPNVTPGVATPFGVAKSSTEERDTGIIGGIDNLKVSINPGNSASIDISSGDYSLQGYRFSFAGVTALDPGFDTGENTVFIYLDENGLVLRNTTGDLDEWTAEDRRTQATLARITADVGQSGPGSDVARIRDDRWFISQRNWYQQMFQVEAIGHMYADTTNGNDGKISENAGTPFQMDQAAGFLYDIDQFRHQLGNLTNIGKFKIIDSGPSFIEQNPIVVPLTYDDGAGGETPLGPLEWASHSLIRSPKGPEDDGEEGAFFLVISSQPYNSETEAIASPVDFSQFSQAQVVSVARILVNGLSTSIERIIDERPVLGTTGAASEVISPTMQDNYNNSTVPQIVLDDVHGRMNMRDNAVPLVGPLFEISNLSDTQSFFAVNSDRTEIGSEQLDVLSQDASGLPQVRLLDSSSIPQASLRYDETADQAELAALDGDMNIVVPDTMQAAIVRAMAAGDADLESIMALVNPGSFGATVPFHASSREPFAAVTGDPGSVLFRSDGNQSKMYLHKGAAPDAAEWFTVSVNTPAEVEVFVEDDLDLNVTGVVSTSGDVITVTGELTLFLKRSITTTKRFVVEEDANLKITTQQVFGAGIQYSGTETFITGSGSVRISEAANIDSLSTATLFDLDTGTLALLNCFMDGWDDLGTFAGGIFLARLSAFSNITVGLNLNDAFIANVFDILVTGDLPGQLFTVGSAQDDSHLVFTRILAFLAPTGSILDIDPRTTFNTLVTVSQMVPVGGSLFKESQVAPKVVNSVADASVAGTITAFADNGDDGTTVSSSLLVFQDEVLTIDSSVNYNGTFRIFNVVPNVSFDIDRTFIADDATGNINSARIDLTLPLGHGVVAADNIGLVNSNFYNGFRVALNVTPTTVLINGDFVETDSCELNLDVGLNHTDLRVFASNNTGLPNSSAVGAMHVEKNVGETIIATDDLYQDANFVGSTGAITAVADNGMGGSTITSAAHGLLENQNVKNLNTTQYNGAFRIFNVTTDTYDVNAPFIATQTGTWESEILLEQSSNLFRVSDQDSGELEFVGNVFRGVATITLSVLKSGSSAEYIFALARNGLVVDGDPFAERTVTTAIGSVGLVTSVQMITGDKIKPQVAGVGTTSPLIFQSMSISILGDI